MNRISAPGASDQPFSEVLFAAYGPALPPELRRSSRANESFQSYRSAVLDPRKDEIGRRYDADLAELVAAVEDAAWLWLVRSLNNHVRILQMLRIILLASDTVEKLHRSAVEYGRRRRRFTAGVPRTDPLGRATVEYRALERGALELTRDPLLDILFTLPGRERLFASLEVGPQAARDALAAVLRDAEEGLNAFGDEISADRSRLWRYPPIVAASVANLIGEPTNEAATRNMLTFELLLAHDLAGDAFGAVSFVAGTAVAAAALVWNPVGWAAIILYALDVGIAGTGAYLTYRRERENDLTTTATAIVQGQPFTDRPTRYGTAALEAAAALLTAMAGVPAVRNAVATATKDVRLLGPPARQTAVMREALQEAVPIGEVLERNTAAADRLAMAPTAEQRAIRLGESDRPPAVTTRTQSPLRELGYDRPSPHWQQTRARPPQETVEDFVRSLGLYGRHPRTPLTPEEAELFRAVSLDEWNRVIAYAESNALSPQAVFAVAGKIEEILIERLPVYQPILRRALAVADKLDIPLHSVRFVTGLSERGRELIDAAILAIHKDRLYVLAVFEAKSEGNILDLVTRGTELGQFVRDLRRLRRDAVRVGARTFAPNDIVAGPELTEWIAVLPSDRSLSHAAIASVRSDVGNLTVINTLVRNEALHGIAADILKRLRVPGGP